MPETAKSNSPYLPNRQEIEEQGETRGCVYQAKNLLNGKCYIGKTIGSLKGRTYGHIHDIKKGSNSYFHNAIRKYGLESFQWNVLYRSNNENDLLEMEKEFIKLSNTMAPNGYNISLGGKGSVGYHHSDEAKAKIRKAAQGKKHSKESIDKMRKAKIGKVISLEAKMKISQALKGRKLSEETKRKIGKAGIGRKPSEETRVKLHNAQLGNTKGLGRKHRHTEESKAKMSLAQKGKEISKETRAKISNALIGHKISEETKAKIGVSNKGKKRSAESLQRGWETRRLRLISGDKNNG